MLIERHVFHQELGLEGGRRLLDWCRRRGADAFTVTLIGSELSLDLAEAQFQERLDPFALDPSRIPPVDPTAPGSHWADAQTLWQLNSVTATILLGCFPQGLLTYFPANDTWWENPCLYRGPDLLLGIISHEGEGVLRIDERDQVDLDKSGLPYRMRGEWAGYP